MSKRTLTIIRKRSIHAAMSFALTALVGWSTGAFAAAPSVSISQVPMTITVPAHPQIMLALANSESTDGTLAGAIMTGSGLYSDLQNSSSPVNFTIPAGFTPPLNTGNGVTAPYTVASGGYQADNSPSRLNVAKAGISTVLSNYVAYADFGLMDYMVPGVTEAPTWVYQMSPPGGFTFTSTQSAGTRYVANPCYQYKNQAISGITPGGTVYQDCETLHSFYAGQHIEQQQWMSISASSDDPTINDVLYDPYGGVDPVCLDYTNASTNFLTRPPSPFPPSGYTLANFNTNPNNVTVSYVNSGGSPLVENPCAYETGPTNAGYVPFSTQVMYVQRGFGYFTGSQQPGDVTAGTVLVPIGPANSAGQNPTTASVNAALAKFAQYLLPETNSPGTGSMATPEIKASGVQSPIAGLIQAANNFYAKVNPPSSNTCATSRYVVLITDGLPTLDSSGKAWPPLGSAAANNVYGTSGATAPYGFGVSATFNTDGSLNTTNDQALTDAITQLKALNALNIKTYIIAVGAGVDPIDYPTAAATLTAMAIAGGTGAYFAATSPGAVSQDLQSIINTILKTNQSVSSAAVNSTGLNTSSVVYQSQFDSSDSYQDWTGNLYSFPISATTGIVNTTPPGNWSAQTQLDAQVAAAGGVANRIIATWDPVAHAGTPFEWNSNPSVTGISATTGLGKALETFSADTNGQDVLNYLRGSSAQEQRNSGAFRNRSHILGDIVDSDPLYVGAPNGSSQLASYTTFATTPAIANRPPVIYVGANDGMLHAFDATLGNELFAYIPTGVYGTATNPQLTNLVSPFYNARHQFFVNGSPQASDVQFSDSSWHTVLVSAEQAGGNSIFAMDVTNPATMTSEAIVAQDVLWDFTDPDMGLGFSTPAIAQTADNWQVFFGNGYNSAQQKPFLYALNAQTGAITEKIDLCAAVPTACNLSASNGLSTVIAVNSGGQIAGNASLVYAGDLQGNLWRINISNSNPANWTVGVLFQARDASGNPQPITTSPMATLNPRYPQVLGTLVFVGTGQLLGLADLSNLQVQTMYGIYDPPNSFPTPVLRSSLVQQSLANATLDGQTVRLVTGNAVSIPSNEGWYIDLDAVTGAGLTASSVGALQIGTGGTVTDQGERIVTDPRLESGGGLVFTTYQPTDNPCMAGGSSFLMVINYATGGAFTSPQFAVDGSTTINANDSLPVNNTSGGAALLNPVGLSLGAVYAAAPTIQNANFTTASKIKLITESSGAIQTIAEKGSSKNRTAWWEIRQ